MSKLRELLAAYTIRLENAGVDSPRLSAEVLLAHSMGISRNALLKTMLLYPDFLLPPEALDLSKMSVARRASGEPVAYITGTREFYGRNFIVSPATLIPRPDTETLIDEALGFASNYSPCNSEPCFIDLGTGSGAIAVTIALELPDWQGIAVDISAETINIAVTNAEILGVSNLAFTVCDFLGPDLPQGPFDMVLANPPYVSEAEYHTLSIEVAAFEPKTALVPPFSASSGLEHLLELMGIAEHLVVPGGLLLMECGCTQGDALIDRADKTDAWKEFSMICDLAGLPRVFRAIRA